MSSPPKRLSASFPGFNRKFSDSVIFQKESNSKAIKFKYYYLALFQRIKNRTLANLQKTLNKNNNKNNNNNNILIKLKDTVSTGFDFLPKIINNLFKNEVKEKVDDLINLISEKYQDEGYFYVPQFCNILKENNYTDTLEQFLLEQCEDKMKFSLYVYWIIISFRQQENKKLKNFLSTLEMSLVNGLSKSKKNIENRTDKEIYEENISKEFRANYYNISIKFYQALKNFCEKLKDYPVKERKNLLNVFLNNQNKKISQLINRDSIKETSKLIQALYRGYILPFNDAENTLDDESYLIVKFDNTYSNCLSTKARVPCKIVFEVVKVKDLKNFEEYYLDDMSNITRRQSIVNLPKISIDENNKEIKDEIKLKPSKSLTLNDFLYNEIKEEEDEEIQDNNININKENKENKKKKKDKISTLIQISSENRSLSTGEPPYFFTNYNLINLQSKYGNPFGEKWLEICQKIKQTSSYRNFPSYLIKSFIAKSDDDLRQESLAMQFIKMIQEIFNKSNSNLKLRTYEIIITSRNSGLIEFIPDSISIHTLKKKTGADLNTFYREFFAHHFKEAQKNFIESLAAYCLVTYILNLKDRHNGNIMIDIQGRIIHIDFGFILGISPGGVGFETAPFKMTKEYVNLLDGVNSEGYKYFIDLLTQGFLEIRKYFDSFVKIIEITGKNSDMPCFVGRDINLVLRDFIERFHLEKNEKDIKPFMELLAKNSINSWRTYQYDIYQQITNGIKP